MIEQTFYRAATRAFLRDGKIEYSGDALMLALLLHTKKSSRNAKEEEEVKEILGVYKGNKNAPKGGSAPS